MNYHDYNILGNPAVAALASVSGGKVQLSHDGSFVACLYECDVSFLDVEDGVVTRRLRKEGAPGAEEEIVRAFHQTCTSRWILYDPMCTHLFPAGGATMY